MARGSTKVKDKGLQRLLADVRVATKMAVSVGVHGAAESGDPDPNSTPLVVYAAANEFGTDDGHVPERSFIRSTVDEELPRLREIRNRALARIALRAMRPRQAIGLIGAYLQGKIQEKIASGVPPPNAPATIAAKGSSTTLIDTGRLRQAITFQIHDDGFEPAKE